MKIIEKKAVSDDFREYIIIKVKDDLGEERSVSFSDGEPEDASLARDFSDVYSIISLMRLAYECGKRGEEFNVESKTISIDEFWS